MGWRGFRRLGGQIRQRASPNRALAAVLSKVTREEEESLRLLDNELKQLPSLLKHAQRIYGGLSVFVNGIEALSRFEQKRLQRSILIQKSCTKLGSSVMGIVDAGFQPATSPRLLKTITQIRAQAQQDAAKSMASLKKHKNMTILANKLIRSMTKLNSKIAIIQNIEQKLSRLSEMEAADEKAADNLASRLPELTSRPISPIQN
jgi:hypothetical protein|tara:strand:+ start:4138 stop:4749 length:612 start_codon:yes stop_codon:yes gene_type:complete